jgi:hypothetical protein
VLVRPKHTGIREFRTIPVRKFYPADNPSEAAQQLHIDDSAGLHSFVGSSRISQTGSPPPDPRVSSSRSTVQSLSGRPPECWLSLSILHRQVQSDPLRTHSNSCPGITFVSNQPHRGLHHTRHRSGATLCFLPPHAHAARPYNYACIPAPDTRTCSCASNSAQLHVLTYTPRQTMALTPSHGNNHMYGHLHGQQPKLHNH